MKEILILDGYLDEQGAWRNFAALMPGRANRAVRVAYEAPPALDGYAALVLTGSAASAVEGVPWLDPVLDRIREARERALPVLGVCFGHQLVPLALFGPDAIRRSPTSELGWLEIRTTDANPLIAEVPERFPCFVSHFDEVTPGVPELDVFAESDRCAVQGYQVRGEPIWGVQFHPEMPYEESERLVLRNASEHEHIRCGPEELLTQAVDASHVGRRLFANFLARVDAEEGAA